MPWKSQRRWPPPVGWLGPLVLARRLVGLWGTRGKILRLLGNVGVTASAPLPPNCGAKAGKYSKISAYGVSSPLDGVARLVHISQCWSSLWDSRGGSLSEHTISEAQTPSLEVSEPRVTEAQFPWFALQVHAKHEFGVASSLRSRGYDPFLPLHRCRKLWSDRIKVVEAPLFPGYMFCRLNLHHRLPVLTAPGVIRIVGHTRRAIPVDEAEINAIQAIVASGLPTEPWPFLRAGDRVRIERGPLRGLEGILVETRGAHRLILSVTLVQRSVAVEIDSAFVKFLRPAVTTSDAGPNVRKQ